MFNSMIGEEEDNNIISQDNSIDSSDSSVDGIQSYFERPTFVNNTFHYSKENNNQNIIKEIKLDLSKIINDIQDLVKCYICLGQIKEPKMCIFCHRLACGDCLRQWLREKKHVGIVVNY